MNCRPSMAVISVNCLCSLEYRDVDVRNGVLPLIADMLLGWC